MSKSFKQWVYHATKKPKIIDSEQFEDLSSMGWKDSPAEFCKTTDFGVDPEDANKVQALGESIDGVASRLNGELNISIMNKDQLEEFALEHLNIDLDKRHNVRALRKQVKRLLGK